MEDKDLLKSCFIYTCLSRQNKCISFNGSDCRFYKNELCFDNDTLASADLKQFKLNEEDKELLELWKQVLDKVKEKEEYNKSLTYGLYQIEEEINIQLIDEKNNKYYKYTDLNSVINSLKQQLKVYYKNFIQDKLFQYELLK